jgi:hypothetical protein
LYTLNPDPNQPGNGWTAFSGQMAVALNNNGQACGFNQAQPVNTNYATVWTYSISGGTMTSTGTALQYAVAGQATGGPLATAWNNIYGTSLYGSQCLAINDSGTVVIGGSDAIVQSFPLCDDGFLLYNMNTQQYTSLGGLSLWDPMSGFGSVAWCGNHQQAINNSGAVVGYIGTAPTAGGGFTGSYTWQAYIWQNGTLTNLNTEYASVLPAGFVLNNATAIDNNGDIVGFGTYNGNSYQAFEILNLLPGDANGDGTVDINDLTIVLAHYNQTGQTWSAGEFTGSGTVDINDLTIVLAHYSETSGSSAGGPAAVPEPCALALLAAGAAGLLACAWRRRR